MVVERSRSRCLCLCLLGRRRFISAAKRSSTSMTLLQVDVRLRSLSPVVASEAGVVKGRLDQSFAQRRVQLVLLLGRPAHSLNAHVHPSNDVCDGTIKPVSLPLLLVTRQGWHCLYCIAVKRLHRVCAPDRRHYTPIGVKQMLGANKVPGCVKCRVVHLRLELYLASAEGPDDGWGKDGHIVQGTTL